MNPFKGRHFQRDIILWAVRWYCKYGISYRELQEMLAERGVNVDHSTIYRWVPANLERLFDRFYRADSSRVHNTEGAGLGLSITRSIIHAHGGELSAEQQGREIVFSVRLLMD
ncbi:ATP-binding protein [Enterobacter asburiae]|uniref:ATP-binding protein n=1 Tax=Enterobacter asburiae TaxID=61645 RepID=UPI00374E014B